MAIDSRQVQRGDLFFALSGNRVDGHQFLKEVAAKGGIAAVVRTDYQGEDHGLFLIRVPDVLLALQELARKVLEKRAPQVVAITGSLGKTTTKAFASTLLRSKYRLNASPLSYNSQITLPLSILIADGEEDILLLEMGMSEPGNLQKLISVAPPDIAVITTIAVQHANNFSDGLSGIAKEKSVIFTHPKTKLGILHRDIHHFEQIMETGRCVKQTFSLQTKESDYFLEFSNDGIVVYPKGKQPITLDVRFPLRPYYQNFLAALAVARALNVSWEEIAEAIPHLKTPPMRFERVEKKGIIFINDAFNANPDSVKAALESLPSPEEGRKTIAVLSEMNALGMYSEGGHALVAETALQCADVLLCIGERCETMRRIWKREKRSVELCETREELEKKLKEIVQPGDVVLIKGARAYALEQILKGYE